MISRVPSLLLALNDIRTESRPEAPVLVRDGRFNLSGIMRRAVQIARRCRLPGLSWARQMSVGLRSAWAEAKAAMAEGARQPAANVQTDPLPVRTPRPLARPVRVFHSGSRAHSHGW